MTTPRTGGTDAAVGGDGAPAAGPERPSSGDSLTDSPASLAVLTDAPPEESVVARGAVPVPTLTVVALGLTVGFTVVFGIIPAPILDFAHHATLLFS